MKNATYLMLIEYTKALSVALGQRDSYTHLHSERVAFISEELGKKIELSEPELEILVISATFHDVGKIGVPDKILMKPLALEEPEIEVMQHHSSAGSEIIRATGIDGAEEVARAIRHHHECYDGTGYPDGLAGEQIPLASRIIGIADSYDAMAAESPYRKPKKHGRIMEILDEETGRKHDPNLMSVFREVIETSRHRGAD